MKQLIAAAASACLFALHAEPAYTLRMEEFLSPHDGGPMRISQGILIAQRSDGTRAEVRITFLGKSHHYQERTVILPSQQQIVVSDAVGLRTSGFTPPPEIAKRMVMSRRSPGSNCLSNGYKVMSTETIGGLRTVKIANEHIQAWHALDLQCQEVQRNAGAHFASELRFVSYTPGEPDAALFEFASLAEAPMRERLLKMYRKAGIPEEELAKITAQWKADEERQRSARRKPPAGS